MPALIVIAAIVILAGVVVVAMGRGGELARDRLPEPAASDFRTWYDVAAYRPPTALLGYDAAATEQALSEIARAIADRDAEIDVLRRRLAAAELPADQEWQAVVHQADQGPAVLDPADQGLAE
ncbi:MAG TPA: hypothetical protein VH520_12650 [Streptosporangiaceae bacterium]